MENRKLKTKADPVQKSPVPGSKKPKKKRSKPKKVDQQGNLKVDQGKPRLKKKKKVLDLLPSGHKLIVRKLPPLLTTSSFLDQIYKFNSEIKSSILSCYYVQGEYPANPYLPFVHSRCYIQCLDEQSLISVGKMIKEMKFTDGNTQEVEAKGEEMKVFTPFIEKAIFGQMPPYNGSKVSNPSNNTIEEEPLYKHFTDFCNSAGLFEKKEGDNAKKVEHPKDILNYVMNVVNRNLATSQSKKSKESKKKEQQQPAKKNSKKDTNKEVKKELKKTVEKGKPAPKRKPKKKTAPTPKANAPAVN